MEVAVIGLPNSGKTTLFNALTGAEVETTSFSSGRLEPNVATIKVPDPRIDRLNEIYRPRKLTLAEVQYLDIGGFGEAAAENKGLSPELLHCIGTADALLHVVGAFEDERVPHPFGSVDIARDVSAVEGELMLSDLLLIERRLERLEKEIRKVSGSERTQKAGSPQKPVGGRSTAQKPGSYGSGGQDSPGLPPFVEETGAAGPEYRRGQDR